jgi:hypothetical protein
MVLWLSESHALASSPQVILIKPLVSNKVSHTDEAVEYIGTSATLWGKSLSLKTTRNFQEL